MIDLYRAYLSDLSSIGSRYTTANSFYMSIVTALLGLLALTDANKPFSAMRTELVLVVIGFAVIICWIWRKTIDFYRSLFLAKFEVLRISVANNGRATCVPSLCRGAEDS